MVASHQSTPAWRADGVNVVVVEDEARVGEGVDVGGGDLVGPVEADIVPALMKNIHLETRKIISNAFFVGYQIICDNYDDVWPLVCCAQVQQSQH